MSGCDELGEQNVTDVPASELGTTRASRFDRPMPDGEPKELTAGTQRS